MLKMKRQWIDSNVGCFPVARSLPEKSSPGCLPCKIWGRRKGFEKPRSRIYTLGDLWVKAKALWQVFIRYFKFLALSCHQAKIQLWGIGKNIKKEGACLTISYDYWQTKYCWDVMFRPTNCNYIYKHTESEFELKGFFQSTPSPSPPPSPPPSPSPRPKSATNRVSSTRFYGGAQSHIAIWGALGWGGRGCSELPPTSRLCTVCQLPNIFMRLLFIKQRNVDCGRAVTEAVFWCG